MKTRPILAFAAGAALMLGFVDVASAQRPPEGPPEGPPHGGFGRSRMMGGPPAVMLLHRKDVQRDLKLSKAQIAKVNALGGRPRLDGPPREGGHIADFEVRHDKERAEVQAILTSAQRKRLKEIGVQMAGPFALFQPDVQKALGVTGKQKGQLAEALPRFGELRDGRGPGGPHTEGFGGPPPDGPNGRPGPPPEGFGGPGGPGGPGPREALRARVSKVLTVKQRAQLKALGGTPFVADRDERPGRPRG